MRSLIALSVCALGFALPAYADSHGGAYLVTKDGTPVTTLKGSLCLRTTRWSEKNADAKCLDAMHKLASSR